MPNKLFENVRDAFGFSPEVKNKENEIGNKICTKRFSISSDNNTGTTLTKLDVCQTPLISEINDLLNNSDNSLDLKKSENLNDSAIFIQEMPIKEIPAIQVSKDVPLSTSIKPPITPKDSNFCILPEKVDEKKILGVDESNVNAPQMETEIVCDASETKELSKRPKTPPPKQPRKVTIPISPKFSKRKTKAGPKPPIQEPKKKSEPRKLTKVEPFIFTSRKKQTPTKVTK